MDIDKTVMAGLAAAEVARYPLWGQAPDPEAEMTIDDLPPELFEDFQRQHEAVDWYDPDDEDGDDCPPGDDDEDEDPNDGGAGPPAPEKVQMTAKTDGAPSAADTHGTFAAAESEQAPAKPGGAGKREVRGLPAPDGVEASPEAEYLRALLEAADTLAQAAMEGAYTKTTYRERREMLLSAAQGEEEQKTLTAYLNKLEGDPEAPYGGFCFKSEGSQLCVEVSPRGTRRLVPLMLAQTVQQRNSILNFRVDSGDFLRYYYTGGVYRPCPEQRLLERVSSELLLVDESLYRGSAVTEAANAIARFTPVGDLRLLNANENLVNLKNGLLHLDTLEKSFHTPKVLSTVQLDAAWTEEDAPTPAFDALLGSICGGDSERETLLLRFLGLCLTNVPGWKLKKALFLYGPGNTGKSVLRSFIERLLGDGNYMNVDLQTLEEDRFASAQIMGKRLTGTSDMSFLKVRQLAIFKQLTGGDRVYAQQKGQKPFSFRYGGLLWFCMNEPPLFGGDKGDWVYDRMILFPCGATVPEKQRDPNLYEKLWKERNAVVRRLLLAAKWVIDHQMELPIPDSLEAGKAAYRQQNDPVEHFFMTCCRIRPTPEISPLDECTSKNVFEVFRRWCADNAPGYFPRKSEFKKTCARLLALPEAEIVVRNMKTTYFIFKLSYETIADYGDGLFIKTPAIPCKN